MNNYSVESEFLQNTLMYHSGRGPIRDANFIVIGQAPERRQIFTRPPSIGDVPKENLAEIKKIKNFHL